MPFDVGKKGRIDIMLCARIVQDLDNHNYTHE